MSSGRGLLMGVGVLVGAAQLGAQGFAFGVGAGIAHPIQPFKEAAKTGVMLQGTMVFRPTTWPVGIRLDIAHQEFRGKRAATFTYPRHRIEALRLSAEYAFAAAVPSHWKGWIFAGGGAYYDKTDRGQPQQPLFGRTHPGIQVGVAAAYQLGWIAPYLEAQYNGVWRSGPDDKFFPILLGVRIGPG